MQAPIAVYTSGKGSSAAGLTASVIKDSNGEFFLEVSPCLAMCCDLCTASSADLAFKRITAQLSIGVSAAQHRRQLDFQAWSGHEMACVVSWG